MAKKQTEKKQTLAQKRSNAALKAWATRKKNSKSVKKSKK